jgi:hypothetical protein
MVRDLERWTWPGPLWTTEAYLVHLTVSLCADPSYSNKQLVFVDAPLV